MKLTVGQIAERIGAELIAEAGGEDTAVVAVGPIEAATAGEITFLANEKHKGLLSGCRAAAVIVSCRLENYDKPQLLVGNVNAALIEALGLFAPRLSAPTEGIDPTARIGRDVVIGKGAAIEAGVVIDDGVEIGESTIIGSGCKIGQNSTIGRNSRIDRNVVIYHNCRLGNHVVVQANTTIGSTGFGYSFIDGAHRLIPHNGGVIIEDFVEIGANCCVDRAKFGNTIIGAGTKIDNLVQIAHNSVIGKCCLIAALVGISGSCKLGDGVVLGGQVGLADNIEIGPGTMVGAKSGVVSNLGAGLQVAWTPAIEKKEAFRIIGLTMRLPKMAEKLKQLSKRLAKLEAAEDDKE